MVTRTYQLYWIDDSVVVIDDFVFDHVPMDSPCFVVAVAAFDPNCWAAAVAVIGYCLRHRSCHS